MAPDKLHLVLKSGSRVITNEGVNSSSFYIADDKPEPIPKGFRGHKDETKHNYHWTGVKKKKEKYI